MEFQSRHFPIQNNTVGTHLCLIVEGIGPSIRLLAGFQKTNNVVMICNFCQVSFLRDDIFDKGIDLFVTLCQSCYKCQVTLAILTKYHCQILQVTLLGHLMLCNLQNNNCQNMPRKSTIRRQCLKIKLLAIFT